MYASFVRVSGGFAVSGDQRMSDVVNGVDDYLELRDAVVEPLAVNHPVLSRREPRMVVVKASVCLICPLEGVATGHSGGGLWRERVAQPAAITTQAFSMVADVHLDPRRNLREHLELFSGDFLPLTNLSALWVAGGGGGETHAMQRAIALLNPRRIVAFSLR